MKIQQIECFAVELPLKEPFVISYASYSTLPSLIVKITLDNGTIGYGEGLPDEHVTGESMYGAFEIVEKILAPRLIGMNPLHMERIHELMNQEIYASPTAKAAIDIACYDAAAKSLHVPIYSLIGGRYHDEFPITHVLSIQTPDEMAKEAVEKMNEGYHSFKMKVGSDDIFKDVKRIEAVREAIGTEPSIRVDVNQGWKNSATSLQALSLLEHAHIDWIEQPILADDIRGMVEIKQKSTIPVMIDEGLRGINEMRTIIQEEAAHKVNIKLMKCGGIYPANKIAIMAEMANIECQVGSMVESSIGSAAGFHVAFSKQAITSVELTGPLKFSKDLGNLNYDIPFIRLNDRPGLGIDVKENILQELTIKHALISI